MRETVDFLCILYWCGLVETEVLKVKKINSIHVNNAKH